MTINIAFKSWSNMNMTVGVFGHIYCTECKKLSIITFTKPLKCNRCGAILSEYSAYISRTINSRIIYHSAKRKSYP